MSPSRGPVFSCAHYFQAPATQAKMECSQAGTHLHKQKPPHRQGRSKHFPPRDLPPLQLKAPYPKVTGIHAPVD